MVNANKKAKKPGIWLIILRCSMNRLIVIQIVQYFIMVSPISVSISYPVNRRLQPTLYFLFIFVLGQWEVQIQWKEMNENSITGGDFSGILKCEFFLRWRGVQQRTQEGARVAHAPPPPRVVKNSHKKMAAMRGGLDVMFLGPPLQSFWIHYWCG